MREDRVPLSPPPPSLSLCLSLTLARSLAVSLGSLSLAVTTDHQGILLPNTSSLQQSHADLCAYMRVRMWEYMHPYAIYVHVCVCARARARARYGTCAMALSHLIFPPTQRRDRRISPRLFRRKTHALPRCVARRHTACARATITAPLAGSAAVAAVSPA